jgi:hypothetical protein
LHLRARLFIHLVSSIQEDKVSDSFETAERGARKYCAACRYVLGSLQ